MTTLGLRSSLAGILLGILPASATETSTPPVLLDGCQPGRWTMDFDAARQYAARKKLPLFINFTGSDWCGWCKVMDETVFHKKEWTDFAVDNVVLVTIDFPRAKNIVPEKWTERNSQFKKHFDVRGYPTYVVVAPDGTAKLGHLMANRGKSPESFIQDVLKILAKATDDSAK